MALLALPARLPAQAAQDQQGGHPAAAAPPSAGTVEGELSLAQAIDLALSANPTVVAARLGRPIARASIDVAAERPNPDILLEKTRETPHEAVTLSLPIETARKRQRRIAVAQADALAGEAEIARTAAEIRNRVRRAFFALLAAQRRVSENEAALRLTERTRDAARQRFEAGAVPRLEVLQGELLVAQAGNELESARAQLVGARGDLNTLLARPPQNPVAATGDLASGALPEAAAALGQAMAASTELAILARRVDTQAAKVELARAQQVPNPTVQGAIVFHNPPDWNVGWRTGLSLTLPIFTTHRAEVLVEETTLAQLKAQREALASQISGTVYGAVAQAAAARGQLLRFQNEILPQAAAVAQMAEESYRSGETGLVNLLQTLQSTRDLRLKALQAGLDYQVAVAELERAIGAPLP
ncbi:MAG TPA: TolC family protein [Thermoanaerobaculia bacterium]|nr:TolC family protein [Thermoanaerobaculia bacterium]